ncbi:type I restriction enzyme S subunit [Paenibacillus taihuensis]|uniref:Type I restriction enzyme S subunit n=1 Tax=Paenibacillus taihuensis TaxID=1156355 RepID=A0A3D9QU30_9BACL|nr:restriction endonuclease subunit S [Paenibacillus taihuensis]REE67022.1 type I restriction enzyme S subunit [Paenibacillus taihuensis]
MINVKVGQILSRVKEPLVIKDDCEYRRLTIRMYHNGVYTRDIEKGINIGTKNQFIARRGQFIMSRIDARNGAFGIIPETIDVAAITNDFLSFEVNKEYVNMEFFKLYSQTDYFMQLCLRGSIGTTNRKRLKEEVFLNFDLNLPDIHIQERVVQQYNKFNKLNETLEIEIRNQSDLLSQFLYSKYTEITSDVDNKPMKEIAPIIRRPVEVEDDELYPELGIRSFGKGTFHKPALTGVEIGNKKLYQIHAGDVVFSNVFAWEGAIAVASIEDDGRVGSHRFISCRPDLKQVNPYFLFYHFINKKGLEDINRASPGGAGRNKTLGLTKLENIFVPIPDIEEQNKFVLLLKKVNEISNNLNEPRNISKIIAASLLSSILI